MNKSHNIGLTFGEFKNNIEIFNNVFSDNTEMIDIIERFERWLDNLDDESYNNVMSQLKGNNNESTKETC